MTCIVALEHKTGIVLASDNQVTSGDTGFLLHPAQRKIGFNGEYLIGTAGRLRTGQVLMRTNELPDPPEGFTGKDLDYWMTVKFPVYVQEILKHHGIEKVDDNERLMTESQIIFCVRGEAFTVDEDYCVSRAGDPSKVASGVAVVGSGTEFALGAYHALGNKSRLTPQELARTMVEAAIRWDLGCGGEVFMLEQSKP